jgi:ACR3 family arsenite transporter
LGKLAPSLIDNLRRFEFGGGSQINVPIAVLIWLMIYPMMLKVDFASVLGVGKRPKGLIITCFVNWLVKPFSMALLAWLFFKHIVRQLDTTSFCLLTAVAGRDNPALKPRA